MIISHVKDFYQSWKLVNSVIKHKMNQVGNVATNLAAGTFKQTKCGHVVSTHTSEWSILKGKLSYWYSWFLLLQFFLL